MEVKYRFIKAFRNNLQIFSIYSSTTIKLNKYCNLHPNLSLKRRLAGIYLNVEQASSDPNYRYRNQWRPPVKLFR